MSPARLALGLVLALLLAAPAPAATPAATVAPPKEAPAHFISRLYAIYATGSRWWSDQPHSAYTRKVYADFYDPSFMKLQNDNGALAGKNGDADLDYDPVCQCQDSGARYAYVSGAPGADGLFNAKVSMNSTETPPWTIVLKPEAGGWRVYDVIDSGGSIRAMLTRHNACMRKYHDDASLVKCFGDS